MAIRMSGGFEVIAFGEAGVFDLPNDHEYHKVEVAIACKGSEYRAVALETWGFAQRKRDTESGRKKVVERGFDPEVVLANMHRAALLAGIHVHRLANAQLDCESRFRKWQQMHITTTTTTTTTTTNE